MAIWGTCFMSDLTSFLGITSHYNSLIGCSWKHNESHNHRNSQKLQEVTPSPGHNKVDGS